jgi:hypothetical protein
MTLPLFAPALMGSSGVAYTCIKRTQMHTSDTLTLIDTHTHTVHSESDQTPRLFPQFVTFTALFENGWNIFFIINLHTIQ